MAPPAHDLMEQGSPAFEAGTPMQSLRLKTEMAEREVCSIACDRKAARFAACKDFLSFDFAASEIKEAVLRRL